MSSPTFGGAVARTVAVAAGALIVLASLTACTKSSPGNVIVSSSTSVAPTSRIPTAQPTGPVSTGAITEKTVGSCPYLTFDVAKGDAGFRLDRITELTQAGTKVGCRFYALQHPNSECPASCLAGEKLPPGNVPGIEIVISRYSNATNARNAFIRTAEAGTNFQQQVVAPGNTGLCYDTTLWSKDNGKDGACTFSKGTKVVVIRTVVVGSLLNVVELAKAVYPKV